MITTVFFAALIALLPELTYQVLDPEPSTNSSLRHQKLVNEQNPLGHNENLVGDFDFYKFVEEMDGIDGDNAGKYMS